MKKEQANSQLKKLWHFIWYDDSIWSWIVNIILAFLIIKFLFYPALGFILSTSHPIVAVVSESMEHDSNFDEWWGSQEEWYTDNNITKSQFQEFKFKNGFNKGDIMILYGKKPENIKVGEVIVFRSTSRADPIIHRVVGIQQINNEYTFTTKGDNVDRVQPFEEKIPQKYLLGVAAVRVPLLGWIKIIAVEAWNTIKSGA